MKMIHNNDEKAGVTPSPCPPNLKVGLADNVNIAGIFAFMRHYDSPDAWSNPNMYEIIHEIRSVLEDIINQGSIENHIAYNEYFNVSVQIEKEE